MSVELAAELPHDAPPQTARRSYRKIGKGLWLGGWALLLAMHLFPIRFTTLRELFVALLLALWAGTLALFWTKRWVKVLCGTVAGMVLAVALLPGRTANPAALREAYLASLRSYEETLYVWGGEARTGIDCSGLVRCGLIDANVNTGLKTLNPALLRAGVSLWWNDCSAKALGEEYRGQTRLITETESINVLDPALLQPGDIAVTETGLHTMAYLGNGEWIEADPAVWKVIRHTAPDPDFIWFTMKMRILRWRTLE